MKSIGVCLLFALVAAQPALSQQRKTDRERDGLSGEVYAVRESHNFPAGGAFTSHTTSYYDKNGNLTLKLEYAGGRMVKRRSFRYTGPDELVEKIEDGGVDPALGSTGPNPPPMQTIKHSLKYGVDGLLDEDSRFSEDGTLLEKAEFKYDRQGRLLTRRERVNRGDKAYSETTTFTYHGGAEPSSISYEPFPGHVTKETYSGYELDARGNWTKKQNSGTPKEIERTITYYTRETGEGIPMPGETAADALQPRPASLFEKIIIRRSGGVLQGLATRRVEPSYPPAARMGHITGQVVVEVRIDHQGDVVEAHALSGPQELQDASVAAAGRWKFQPTRLMGVPVDVIGTITFHFEM
jgi:TonB family protein